MLLQHKAQPAAFWAPLLSALLLVQLRFSAGAAVLDTNAGSNTTFYEYQPPTASGNRLQVLQLSAEDGGHEAMAKSTQNLTAITWAHAVNSQLQLDEALGSDIDMIEADIVLGKLNSTGVDLPVMAHPPANSSDISLAQFLTQITAHNDAVQAPQTMKGVKLDFKSIEVFEGSLEILSEMIPTMSVPVWLNADIIPGPVNQTSTIPVDPDRFFAGSAKFEQAVLSIGWTTRWGASYTDGSYTPAQIDDMLQAIRRNNVTTTQQPITFPVRAGLAANSRQQLHDLVRALNATNAVTLTVWSSQNDFVDVEKLRQLIFSFGVERVYLDVPEELASQLDLGRSAGGALARMSLLKFGLIGSCLLLSSYWLQRSL